MIQFLPVKQHAVLTLKTLSLIIYCGGRRACQCPLPCFVSAAKQRNVEDDRQCSVPPSSPRPEPLWPSRLRRGTEPAVCPVGAVSLPSSLPPSSSSCVSWFSIHFVTLGLWACPLHTEESIIGYTLWDVCMLIKELKKNSDSDTAAFQCHWNDVLRVFLLLTVCLWTLLRSSHWDVELRA